MSKWDFVKSCERTMAVWNSYSGVSLEDAQRLFDEGCHCLRSQDYGQAAELLSRSLEIRYSVIICSLVSDKKSL